MYEGDTADASTLIRRYALREQFGLERLVSWGSRHDLAQSDGHLRSLEGLAWITALKSAQIHALVQGGELQLGLLDERNLLSSRIRTFPVSG